MNPDEFTISESFLDVGDGHQLYIQDWGNKKAKAPIIFLHGGPGSHVKDKFKQVVDPLSQRVVFFDQRGCGRSKPYGSIENNTTNDSIADIVKIADKLQIKNFILHGGSWGSCLALATALKHPNKIKGLVITGVFTGSEDEINWLDQGQFKTFFPDVWQKYIDSTPNAHQKYPSLYHFNRILKGNEAEQKESSYLYGNLEAAVLQLDDRFLAEQFSEFDHLSMRIEVYYLASKCFLPDRHILENAYKLKMPVKIVQGRYDMVCPPKTAFELHEKLPNSELVTTLSGHKPEHEDIQLIRQFLKQLTA